MIDLGDLFDAMQGRHDPRSTKEALKTEVKAGAYWDALVEYARALFEPYAAHFAFLARGNHEYAVLHKAETDLTRRLARELGAIPGEYRGFIELVFYREDEGRRGHLVGTRKLVIYYAHGSGGSAPVTRGVIQTNRRSVYVPDADLVLSGHIHESWLVEVPRIRLENGEVFQDTQFHLQIPSYKCETMADGWADMREMSPKPVGAWYMIVYYDGTIKFKLERAL